MKKLLTFTKKAIILISIVSLVSIIGSCDKNKVTQFTWDENAAPTLIGLSATAAKAGEELTITGKYFSSTADNTVSFSGVAATIISANISMITVIVPDAPDGDITVTSNGKTSANSLPYTIIQPITPTITAIDPVKGKVGQTVVITGTDFSTIPAENIVSFNGARANVSESTATTITTSVPAGASTGNVTVSRDGESNGILFTVTISYSVVVPITESWDDVEEGALNGAMANESSDLEVGEYDTWTQNGIEQGVQTIGLRFNNIDIPAGATVLSANLQFTCDATGDDDCEMTIYAENVGNAMPFTEDFYNVSTRTKTVESVVWTVPPWLNSGDAGLAQKTPDIYNVAQEVLSRADWSAGNSMVFILTPSGATVGETSSSGGREAEAIDGTAATVLTIIYEL